MQFDNILCVCTGNICRSPLAEAYLASLIPESAVSSAGTHALVGEPADDKAIEVAHAQGLDLDDHRAQQLNKSLARAQDLILVMDQGHLEWIHANLPFARGATFLVSQWHDRENVTDPYRGSQADFDSVYERIKLCLDSWVGPLRRAR